MDMSLAGKTIFMSGGSRGIGLAIALRAAQDGANIALAAKTAEPHAKLEGTIYTAAEQIEKARGRALPLVVDIRDEAKPSARPSLNSAVSTSSSTMRARSARPARSKRRSVATI
jgi:citronellol/citronellal dehydrogenase